MVTARERAHLAELRELAALMRERVGLAPLPIPTPLHKMGQRASADDGGTGAAQTMPPSQRSDRQ